jgi:hypothetical protein
MYIPWNSDNRKEIREIITIQENICITKFKTTYNVTDLINALLGNSLVNTFP